MTHDELKALVLKNKATLDTQPPSDPDKLWYIPESQVRATLEGYLALSVKLEVVSTGYALLSERIDEAHNYCDTYRPDQIGRNVWHTVLDDAIRLRVKLEEAQAENRTLSLNLRAVMKESNKPCPSCHTLLLVRGETAQPEVIKACPQCSCMRDKDLVSPMAEVPGDLWHCCRCGHEFAEPAYYQKVTRPQADG